MITKSCLKCGGIGKFVIASKAGGYTKNVVCKSCLPEIEQELAVKGIPFIKYPYKVESKHWL